MWRPLAEMEIALHMTGVEDVIDNPRRVGDKVSMNNKRKVVHGECHSLCPQGDVQ